MKNIRQKSTILRQHLVPKILVYSDHVLENFNMEKSANTITVCVQDYFRFWDIWSLVVLSDVLDSHSWFDYENEGVDFNTSIC